MCLLSFLEKETMQSPVINVNFRNALSTESSKAASITPHFCPVHIYREMLSSTFLDEDGTYDPSNFNDRLLLGLKGTMSEAELHFLKARMRGGMINKARRGELEMRPPVGLVYRDDGVLILDPDVEVQAAIRLVFETFDRTGSAMQTVKLFHQQGLRFPR